MFVLYIMSIQRVAYMRNSGCVWAARFLKETAVIIMICTSV